MKTPNLDLRKNGFALVVTLALMILLTVIAVGLLTLSSVSLRASAQGEAMAMARNNARLALMLAIGDMQASLGSDRAVTAGSSILASSPAKPNTAGVWESWDYNPNGPPLDYTGEKKDRFRRWLVSSADPGKAQQLDFGNSAWSGKTVELVGAGAFGGGSVDANQKALGGLVPLAKNGKVQGGLAYHVSDESLKARINLYRDPSQNTTVAQKRALLAGHRPDFSGVKLSDGSSLDFLPTDDQPEKFEKAKAESVKVTDLSQVSLLEGGKKIAPFRNEVTPYSLGVLANARTGGLKKDLTSVFEMSSAIDSISLPTEMNNKKLYQSTHGITGVSDPNWSTLAGYYNTFKVITNPETSPTFYRRPTTGVTVTPGQSTQVVPTRYYPGPVIAKVESLFTYVTRDSHANWVGDLKSVDPKILYMGHLIYTPLVTLHNPYNVNIQFDDMEVTIRNMPVAFNFSVNGVAQSTRLVPLTDMFVYDRDRREKMFVLKIANWSSYSGSSSGPIVMKPGQTLVCTPYVDPNLAFGNGSAAFFDWENRLTGVGTDGTITPIRAKPGFAGRSVGFDVDWITPTHAGFGTGSQSDGNRGVLGLRDTDNVSIEYGVGVPSFGMNTEFQVTAKITSQSRTFEYGGLQFIYQDDATLKKYFPKTYRYPLAGGMSRSGSYASNSTPLNQHAYAQTFAVFSAYARTTSGGVYETNSRTPAPGAVNSLRDGRLAGKPFLHHNPARPVMSTDLQREKPGNQSHELNFQQFLSNGQVEDYITLDNTNRTCYLTGNSNTRGIKSGSYLELPTGPMQTIADFRRSNALTSTYLPSFVQPVGNSWVSPLMGTDKVVQTDSSIARYAMLDHSVLANHALYDGFYFSTYATVGKNTPDVTFSRFMSGETPLPSQAFQPYLPPGKSEQDAKGELFTGSKPKANAYEIAAEYQMIRGPFNVNSTNVQAWRAVLSAMNKSEIVSLWVKSGLLQVNKSTGVPILPMSLINGGSTAGPVNLAGVDDQITSEWNGYRELSDSEIQLLAEKIVEQVRLRGPFLSMSEFVNRRIGANSELTRMGALEAALEQSKLNTKLPKLAAQIPITETDISDVVLYNYKTPQAATGNPAAGAPGWISQGDLMRILEPSATVRSDTFVIRTYGEALDATGKNVIAKAWAEAVVQRVPEYVDPADRPSLNVSVAAGASPVNKTFGRRFAVVSFRWLTQSEV